MLFNDSLILESLLNGEEGKKVKKTEWLYGTFQNQALNARLRRIEIHLDVSQGKAVLCLISQSSLGLFGTICHNFVQLLPLTQKGGGNRTQVGN